MSSRSRTMVRTGLLAGLVACVCAACGGPSGPEVLQLSTIEPRSMELGDRIVITGQNFPSASDIRRIHVTFRGALSRPGVARCTSPVETTMSDPPADSYTTDSLTGQTRETTYAESNSRTIRLEGPDRLELQASEELLHALTRCPGERGSVETPHATISLAGLGPRGAPYGVTVSIEGLTGRVAVRGTLRGPTLDVRRATSRHFAHDLEARRSAERALEFMGIDLASGQPGEGGLRVGAVRLGSPADRAGILGNDLLVRIDGVNILSLADFRPAQDASLSVVTTLRGEILDDHAVSLRGMVPRTPRDLLGAVVVLAALLAGVVLGLGRGQSVSSWVLRGHRARIARAREHGGFLRWVAFTIARAFGVRRASHAVRPSSDDLAPIVVPLALASAGTTIAAAPFSPYVLGARVDVVFAWLATSVVSFAAALLALRARRVAGVGLVSTAARVLSFQIAASIAVIGAVVTAGALDVRSVVSAQAGWPWRWLVFRSPPLLVLAVAYFVTPLAIPPWRSPNAMRPNERGAIDSLDAHPILRALDAVGPVGWLGAEATAVFAHALLGALLFLGGWTLPGITTSHQDTSATLQMLGGSAWIAKAWLVTWGWLWIRRGLATVGSADRRARLCWRYLIPTTVACSAAAMLLYRLEGRWPWTVGAAAALGTFVLAWLTVIRALFHPSPQLLRSP